jgi:hypothetical protein
MKKTHNSVEDIISKRKGLRGDHSPELSILKKKNSRVSDFRELYIECENIFHSSTRTNII